MTTTVEGVETNTGEELSIDGAAEAFLASFEDKSDASKKKPSDGKPEDETDDEVSETTESDDEPNTGADESDEESPDGEGDDEGSEDEKNTKAYVESDDTYVKIKVGEEEHEVKVKDLSRLFGQEAALTRKSQEVADKRKALDDEAVRNTAVLNALLTRAQERSAPYKKIDFLVAATQLQPEELAALRQEAQAAFEDEQFLTHNVNAFMGAIQERQRIELQEKAVATVKLLGDAGTQDKPNPLYIEGWSPQVYDDIRAFATTEGLDKEIVNNLVDAPAIKLLHMAMLFKRGASKIVVTKKVNNTPKKIVKTTSSPTADRKSVPSAQRDATLAKLKKTGSVDDAAQAFLARFTDDD